MRRYKNDMICDLAETYNIYDYKALPIDLLATLVAGLGDFSRVKQKIAGITSSNLEMFIALVDNVTAIRYQLFGGQVPYLFSSEYKTEKKKKTDSFATGDDFLTAYYGR